MNEDQGIIFDRNPPGEHTFTAAGLFLSVHLGHFLRLEQRTTEGVWRGNSLFGDIKVMLGGEDRTFRHTRPARFAHLTIGKTRLQLLDVSPATLRPHVMLRDAPLRHLIEALLAETSAGPTSRMFQDAAMLAIVARLSALNGSKQSGVSGSLSAVKLKRALDFIEDHLAANLSVGDLAQAVGMSPSHFAALFKTSIGEPPHRYQTRRRVERARELLLNGSTPADAAVTVGFYDQSHLSRHMRRILGLSPAVVGKSHIG